MIPEKDKITGDDFEYTYSCDCGWIDWKHADPNLTALPIIRFVEKALEYFEANPTADIVAINPSDLQHQITVPVLGSQATYSSGTIIIFSEISRENWLQVAMAIFREVEYAHENSLWSHLGAISSTWTQGAEEDLTSDLIAFYRALDPSNHGFANAFNTLSRVCRFPSDLEESKQWSNRVYDEYGDFRQIWAWESPRLHDTPAVREYCGDSPRRWPQELRTIQPNYEVWRLFLTGVWDDIHRITEC